MLSNLEGGEKALTFCKECTSVVCTTTNAFLSGGPTPCEVLLLQPSIVTTMPNLFY